MGILVDADIAVEMVRLVAAGATSPLDIEDPFADVPLDAGLVSLLARVDPQTLADDERVDLIVAWERVAAMVAGHQQRALAAVVDATEGCGLAGQDARHEIGAALRLSPVTATERTRVAADLRDRLPATLTALVQGRIVWRQAAVLADGVRDLSDDLAAKVEARVLGRLSDLTVAESRRAVQAAVLAVDPQSAAERHRRARKTRTVERMEQADGMASWWVLMSADTETQMWAELTHRAAMQRRVLRLAGREDPGMDALRVDALCAALLGREPGQPPWPSTAGEGSDAGPACGSSAQQRRGPRCSCGGRQKAAIVLDLATALGLADHPGFLPGYGAVPGPMARSMAADRDWVRWVTDPGTGHVRDCGAHSYRPSQALIAHITARDPACGFPGCNSPATTCDIDHVQPFRAATAAHAPQDSGAAHAPPGSGGGRTVAGNLGPLCRTHHNAKTHARWRLAYDPVTHTKTWTSPLGKTYVKTSAPRLL